jgi:hypothetical protein
MPLFRALILINTITAIVGSAQNGMMAAHMPKPQRQEDLSSICSPRYVPAYKVGMAASDSGRVKRKPLLIRDVTSAMKICSVIVHHVSPNDSKIPPA